MNLPKPTAEATPEARDHCESIAANLYLSAPQLAMLWTLQARQAGMLTTAENQRIARSIAKHLPNIGQRLVNLERLASLGLVEMKDVTPTLTPWGAFVADVRKPDCRWSATERAVPHG